MFAIDDKMFATNYKKPTRFVRIFLRCCASASLVFFTQFPIPAPSPLTALFVSVTFGPVCIATSRFGVRIALTVRSLRLPGIINSSRRIFVAPDGRFEHVHMDIVVMPNDNGYRYCLTMIDRFTRWPEAIPMRNMEAATCARVFYDTWVARFGAPTLITTDQGKQFESQLFDALLCLIGTKRVRTTAYHPQSNGIIERWHRDFKAAIMCHDKQWTKVLPTVLLGLRTRVRLETDCSPADLLYAKALRIPGEFVLSDDFRPTPRPFLEDFREHMREVRPMPVERKDKSKVFFYKDLATCSHVLLLTKFEVKVPLERPYKGPYRVLERVSDRVYKIDVDGKPTCVTVDRLKPAYFILKV